MVCAQRQASICTFRISANGTVLVPCMAVVGRGEVGVLMSCTAAGGAGCVVASLVPLCMDVYLDAGLVLTFTVCITYNIPGTRFTRGIFHMCLLLTFLHVSTERNGARQISNCVLSP